MDELVPLTLTAKEHAANRAILKDPAKGGITLGRVFYYTEEQYCLAFELKFTPPATDAPEVSEPA